MDWIANFFIRPPRTNYTRESLGSDFMRFEGTDQTELFYRRTDFGTINEAGLVLQCSLFSPYDADEEPLPPGPCLVYLHGSAGSRKDALILLTLVAAHKLSLLCFDFAGCGLSDGNYVSLGWHEKDDVRAVFKNVSKNAPHANITSYLLWGRSMGAVTALQYIRVHGLTDPVINGVILDSPYTVLRDLVKELIEEQTSILSPVFKLGINSVRKSIKHLANFDIKDLDNFPVCSMLTVPVIFLHAKDDTFIVPHHSKRLFDVVPASTEKQFHLIEGSHNTPRCQEYYRLCSNFIWQHTAQEAKQAQNTVPPDFIKFPPGYHIDHYLCEMKLLERKRKLDHDTEINLANLEGSEGITQQGLAELVLVVVESRTLQLVTPFLGNIKTIMFSEILDWKVIDYSLFFSLKGSRYLILTSCFASTLKHLIQHNLDQNHHGDSSADDCDPGCANGHRSKSKKKPSLLKTSKVKEDTPPSTPPSAATSPRECLSLST